MNVIADFNVIPIGVGVSLATHAEACRKVLEERGLKHRRHAFGTNVEGHWEDVFAAIKRCHEVLHQSGCPHITTTVKVSTRTNEEQSIPNGESPAAPPES